jgi:hypothetical protein
MKDHSGTYRKGKGTLPLEGGGRRVGVRVLNRRIKETQEMFYGYRAAFMGTSER